MKTRTRSLKAPCTIFVALAAIQGLHGIVKEKEARISSLEERNAELEARVNALEELVEKLADNQGDRE